MRSFREGFDLMEATTDLDAIHNAIPDHHTLEHVSEIFSMLGDPGRLRILCALSQSALKVRDIAAVTHQSQSLVSHSLRLLRTQNVVSASKQGREVIYSLQDQHVRSILALTLTHVEQDIDHLAG